MSARVALAYGVHLYTATGIVWAFLALASVIRGDYRLAFLWLTVAVVVDATDGVLARRIRVKEVLPRIDGRKMDDIVDYMNYTFIPVFLIWHAGWLPEPAWLWAIFPLLASLFLFVNDGAKEDDAGFFGGFPSYWNIVAFYVAVWLHEYGQGFVVGLLLFLSILSLLPVRFVYPTLAPRWRPLYLVGGGLWTLVIIAMLATYPDVPAWLFWLSLVYPVFYTVSSIHLDLAARRARGRP